MFTFCFQYNYKQYNSYIRLRAPLVSLIDKIYLRTINVTICPYTQSGEAGALVVQSGEVAAGGSADGESAHDLTLALTVPLRYDLGKSIRKIIIYFL